MPSSGNVSLISRLRERGVIRVAASYAVIAWLTLQIASVVFDPLGVPKWVMTALIIAAAAGFPLAIALAWFLEIGEHGIERDRAADGMPRPTARGVRHYVDAIVIGVLLVAVVVLLVRQSDLGKPKPPANPAIAVLPFENLSGDPQQEYFSDGLAEEMLDRLGRVPGLRVIARSSSFSFKGQDVDARTVAERLGVTTVLEGSVRRDGQRLKLNARLIDGATGQQTWSGSFDRELTDVFAVQAELARAVVDAIVPAARGEVRANPEPPTTDLSAYDLYLLARTQVAIRTGESLHKAVQLLEQAVALDPGFARAQAQLAIALLFLRSYNDEAPPTQQADRLRQAEAAVHRALALDPNLSEAHEAYANLLRDTERPGVEEEYKQALDSNPNNAAAWHDYAVYLGNNAKRQAESLRATERALELDPRMPTTWANYLAGIADPGGKRFHAEFARAVRMVGDMPAALDRMTLPWAAIKGYPLVLMESGIAKRQSTPGENLPTWINFARAWSMVDVERASQALDVPPGKHGSIDMANVQLLLDVEFSGLRGDWTRVDAKLAALRARLGEDDANLRQAIAFWLSVRGQDGEAAKWLPPSPPQPRAGTPPLLSGHLDWGFGLGDVARVRIYRAAGRHEEARQLADEQIAALRAAEKANPNRCAWDGWVPYAALLANEGQREAAVTALQAAMQCGDLPYAFQPQFPWFRGLSGYPPYEALLRERERRVAQARATMLQLEAAAGLQNGKPLPSTGTNG